MGLYDRDYMGDAPRFRLAFWRGRSLTWWLIVTNVTIFVLWQFRTLSPTLGAVLSQQFTVSTIGIVEHFRVHTLLTHAFSHMDPWHLLFNMLFVWWFGRELEDLYGVWDYAALYLGSAVVAGIGHVLLKSAIGAPQVPALGASGAVMGVVVVYAFLYPNRQIYIWGILPLTIKWAAILYVAMDLMGVVGGGSGVAHAAHLGGALTGLLFYRFDLRPFGPAGPRGRWPFRRSAPRAPRRTQAEVEPPRLEPPPDPAVSARVDALLDKISREGLPSLTEEERSFLHEASRKYRR